MRQVVGGCAEGGIVPEAAGMRGRGITLLLDWGWQKNEAGRIEARRNLSQAWEADRDRIREAAATRERTAAKAVPKEKSCVPGRVAWFLSERIGRHIEWRLEPESMISPEMKKGIGGG